MTSKTAIAAGDVVATTVGDVRVTFVLPGADRQTRLVGLRMTDGGIVEAAADQVTPTGRTAPPPAPRTAIRTFVEKAHAAAPLPPAHLHAAITIAEHLTPLSPGKEAAIAFARVVAGAIEAALLKVAEVDDFQHTGVTENGEVMTLVREDRTPSVEIAGSRWSVIAHSGSGAYVRVNLSRNGNYGGPTRAGWLVRGDEVIRIS